jgi:hypothetical protein
VKEYKYSDRVKLVIKCNRTAADSLVPLLKELRRMGIAGCSRGIRIEDYDGESNFGFDGDGPDHIDAIEMDGELIKSGDMIDYFVKKLQREGTYKKGTEKKFDPREIALGMKEEREHTNSKELMREIVLDHLMEDEHYYTKMKRHQAEEAKMKKAKVALVLVPGELSKAAKLSQVKAGHPAGLSAVQGKTRSKIPYECNVERMKLAKMAMLRMLGASSPEDEGKYAETPTVDRKGKVKGGKAPYPKFSQGVSGMGSQAHDNFGRATVVVKPSQIGASVPEGTTKHTPISNTRTPKK